MKIFSIYTKKDQAIDKAVFIETGFSFKAFIFSYIWLFFNRLWILAFSLIIIELSLFQLSSLLGLSSFYVGPLGFIITLYIGISGMQWKEMYLLKRGYNLTDIVIENNLDAAKLKFFQEYLKNKKNEEIVATTST